MRIDILTVVPELLVSPLNESILKRAQKAGLVEIVIHNIRDWTTDKHRHVDDYPFGGEAGMVMKPEPVFRLITHRIREHLITREISIGDYVLTGGELAAAVIADSVVRLLPGAIGDEESALTDSFQDNLLAPPVYTRPAEFNGWRVPEVLLSGHDARIEEWKLEQALERTRRLRPDLLEK